jgi:hypothetical protein
VVFHGASPAKAYWLMKIEFLLSKVIIFSVYYFYNFFRQAHDCIIFAQTKTPTETRNYGITVLSFSRLNGKDSACLPTSTASRSTSARQTHAYCVPELSCCFNSDATISTGRISRGQEGSQCGFSIAGLSKY